MTESFGARLRVAMDELGPLCAGIDPHPGLLAHWGLDETVQGLETFAMTCVEAFAGTVAVVKPQSAFFERFGSAGVAVLERTLAGLREAGTLSLLDVKRGDIGSTMTAYAQAYLSQDSPLRADAITVSPFLGFESLRPALDLAHENGRGLFVLALTSNPEGAQVQHAIRDGRTVAGSIVDGVTEQNAADAQRRSARQRRHGRRGHRRRSGPQARSRPGRGQRTAARTRRGRPGRDRGRPAHRVRRGAGQRPGQQQSRDPRSRA